MKTRRLHTRKLARRPRSPRLDPPGSAYAARLAGLLKPLWKIVRERVLPAVAEPDDVRLDANFETIAAVFGDLRVAFMQRMLPGAELEAWRASRTVEGQNSREFQRVLGVDPFASELWLRPLSQRWVTENVGLVRTVAESALGDLEQTVYRMVRGGESIKNIREELGRVFSLNTNRARLLARDQVNKFNGQVTEERQTRVGVTKYIWHTSEDQRVRPDHSRLNEKEFLWSKPPITVLRGKRSGERNHPGGDIQCRCWAEPVLKELLA